MPFNSLARRTAASILGAGGVLLGLAAPAVADTPPGCTLGDLTNVMSGVDTAMTAYLFTHPDVNNFLTGLQGQKKDDVKVAAQNYFQANPQVKAELDAIRAPSIDLRNRCNIPQRALIQGVV